MLQKLSILVIEDEKSICDFITKTLNAQNYKTTSAHTGKDGLAILTSALPDLVLLDLGLPDMDGLDIIQQTRRWSSLPIIVISARTQEREKVAALDAGADDYITKPFEIKEVIARIQVQLRHKNKDMVSDLITYGKLRLDRKAHRIYISDEAVDCITKQEFSILELLMEHPKQVFSKEDIFEYAWDEPYMGETKTLDVHISNIRKKLKKITETEYIETVWGIGYKLKE